MGIELSPMKPLKNYIVNWIREWFNKNGADCNAIIGISGGKDSSIVAALCVEALGKDRVIGIQMPNGTQDDINYADEIINYLGIKHYECNIDIAYQSIINTMNNSIYNIVPSVTEQTLINLAPHLRMATLYAYS